MQLAYTAKTCYRFEGNVLEEDEGRRQLITISPVVAVSWVLAEID